MRNHLLTSYTVITFAMLSAANTNVFAQNAPLRVVVGEGELSSARLRSIVVDSNTTGIDAATVVIDGRTPRISAGDSLVIETASDGSFSKAIFKGEIVSIEPVFEAGGTRTTVRSFDRLHRLTRSPKTRTFEKQSDAAIAASIATEAGLAFGPSGPEAQIVHEQVVEYNQTDLEFLRMRASRIGYTVEVDGETLYFRRESDPLPVFLACTRTSTELIAELRLFHPRLSSTKVVKKVIAHGWDPVKKEEIVGEASRPMIPLSTGAEALLEPPGTSLDLGLIPLETVQPVYGAANGTLAALTALDLSAEADAAGNPSLRARAKVILQGIGARFDGKYFVNGASHRFDRDAEDGWHTFLRLVREDRAVFILPEIGDDALVAFEYGDLRRPYITWSLWNPARPAPESPICGSSRD